MLQINIVENDRQLEEAYTIRKTVFVEEQGVPIEEEIDLFEDQSIHFIGYLEERPIVASRLRFVDEYGKLERICVVKEERGNHFGKAIIEKMEEVILNKGYFKAKLNAQTYAIDFYKKLGYEVVSEEFMDAGIPHVTMTKDLST